MPSFEDLHQPLPVYTPKSIYYACLRAFLHTIGNLSDGIRIGNMLGYDSGVMLDYVYKNRASGKLGLGKLIDRVYLNAVGWQGIRLRKVLLEEYLKEAVAAQLQHKAHLRYLDIACGGGEYDIEVLRHANPANIQAELRDYQPENLDKARRNAQAQQLPHVHFKLADAFKAENYQEKWDIIVSSGFWEIIDDDQLVKDCFLHVAQCLEPGSVLLFTIQPSHPQLELIARTLTSHTGKPWIMKLRGLDVFQGWMQEAGLHYVSHRMEQHGIFGVVEAIKR
jgi:2-polyprenyl-3-methyl-5-hydroxy-6-metoxy-1,4-benzoquinol methylase